MPDLLSHSLAAYVVRARRDSSRRAIVLFVAGTVLPDAATFLPTLALRIFDRIAGLEIPLWIFDAFSMFHSPLPFLLLCWALALLVPSAARREVFGNLLGGGWLHIALDLLQRHLSELTYFPFYPFSRRSWELGLLWTESSLYAIPVLAAASLGVAARRRRRRLVHR